MVITSQLFMSMHTIYILDFRRNMLDELNQNHVNGGSLNLNAMNFL